MPKYALTGKNNPPIVSPVESNVLSIVVASYSVPKSSAGQKVVEIVGLQDNPNKPGWKFYRITAKIPIEATMTVTDAKGRKHEYKLHLTQAK